MRVPIMVYRFSFSILSAWAGNDWERAVAMWMREPFAPTPQMELGKKLHEEWEAEGRATGCLPAVFGGKPLNKPRFEKETKREFMLNDWLQIVGVLDVNEADIDITDYKSGVTPATAYSNGWQHKVYHVLYPQAKRFIYRVFNPYTKTVTVAIVHLTPQTLQQGVEWILTNGSDMRAYLEANELKAPY